MSFLFHDYETFGADPKWDRPSQFAALRTNDAFEVVGEPISIFLKPDRDILPDPIACLITGITPQHADRVGLTEPQFFAEIHEQMSVPKTCSLGFNSIRFDDEVTRFGFWRNFFDPYAREWQNGNSRFDLIDVARMCYALRPQGIEWPEHETGKPSFRLSDLAQANRLTHHHAHEALSDVEATVGLARLIRSHQPKLFDFLFGLRDKRRAGSLLDWVKREPVVHSSSRIPAERGATTIVMPLAQHPVQSNAIIVFDLMSDPSALLDLDADAIRERVFVERDALAAGIERIPLKLVHLNKAPALAPLSVLAGVDCGRIGLDTTRCAEHSERLQRAGPELAEKMRRVYAQASAFPPQDAEQALYSGLLSPRDQALLPQVRRSAPEAWASLETQFQDPRLAELLFRYRARLAPHLLNAAEQARWQAWRQALLVEGTIAPERSITARRAQIEVQRTRSDLPAGGEVILAALAEWVDDIARTLA